MGLNLNEVKRGIKRLITAHKNAFDAIGSSQTTLLELASIAGIAEHYKAQGYFVRACNPKGKPYFAMKASTRGDPWNFSHFKAKKEDEIVEIHMNLKVRSAHDKGIYCVDVGITKGGVIPTAKSNTSWECLSNDDLISFGEAKKLVIYPMLLAQFIGIVHEIKPLSLATTPALFGPPSPHLPPTLIAIGHFSGNARVIVSSYPLRNIHINIAESYDSRLAQVRLAKRISPFLEP